MLPMHRRQNKFQLEFQGELLEAEVRELPFREGVELRCFYEGEEFRVSDRGLGEHEALRLLKEELARFVAS